MTTPDWEKEIEALQKSVRQVKAQERCIAVLVNGYIDLATKYPAMAREINEVISRARIALAVRV